MSIFYQEKSPNPSKRCKCIFKDAFTKCHTFNEKLSVSSHEEETEEENIDQEDEVFVSAVITKYMESKNNRKFVIGGDYNAYWDVSPSTKLGEKQEDIGGEEFLSVGSRLSRCSSATSFDAFISAKTRFSRCSSLNNIDLPKDFGRKKSIIMEFCHCQGWPFGLGRKALLPPLPKSPSDSWSWQKRRIKIHA